MSAFALTGTGLNPCCAVSTAPAAIPEKCRNVPGAKLAQQQKLIQLRQTLEGHVVREEYEQAATVRDEIRESGKRIEYEGGAVMSIEGLLDKPLTPWMTGGGPDGDIVLSSRIRLARNLEGVPFPNRADAKAT